MALNGLCCADVPLRNYSLIVFFFHGHLSAHKRCEKYQQVAHNVVEDTFVQNFTQLSAAGRELSCKKRDKLGDDAENNTLPIGYRRHAPFHSKQSEREPRCLQ